VGRPAQRTQGSVLENQFRRPRPGLHGGRLTEILEPLPEPRETSTAPAREDEHRAAGSPSTRPRRTEIRTDRAPHRCTGKTTDAGESHCAQAVPPPPSSTSRIDPRTPRIEGIDPNCNWNREEKKNRELAIFCEIISREQVSIFKEPREKRFHRSTAWRSARAENQLPALRRRRSLILCSSPPAAERCCPRDVLARGLARPSGLLVTHLAGLPLFLIIR
jgi:hypothetical protein